MKTLPQHTFIRTISKAQSSSLGIHVCNNSKDSYLHGLSKVLKWRRYRLVGNHLTLHLLRELE